MFNIVGFGSSYLRLFKTPIGQLYNQESLEQATQYVSTMRADMGGTELLSPLNDILGRKEW